MRGVQNAQMQGPGTTSQQGGPDVGSCPWGAACEGDVSYAGLSKF